MATLGFIGYLPIAPGTWGSAAAAIIVYLWRPSSAHLIAAALVTYIIGIYAAGVAERVTGKKDCGHIIIDEVAGYFVTVVFVPQTFWYLAAAFFVFRFFDIVKPPPVRQVERALQGGLGVMTDDILAGMYSNFSIQLWMMISAKL